MTQKGWKQSLWWRQGAEPPSIVKRWEFVQKILIMEVFLLIVYFEMEEYRKQCWYLLTNLKTFYLDKQVRTKTTTNVLY